MEIKDNVVSMIDYRIKLLQRESREREAARQALFMQQHSDDDIFDNDNEFEFNDED